MSAQTKRRSEPSMVDPQALYSLPEFKRVTRLGPSFFRRAKAAGVELPMLRAGRCKFIRGRDAIEFIERAAAI
ncbi:hypothetical protein Pla111_01640 [Botrimarina hoheduenensis]|uniref:Helix-turn-helix domain protein n=1 Tax=Botrimarina hoheduenensis TaxID=2528000 RepID=A0A5C5WBX1_9BACT|nr:hypothetical protein Pla111_01640 [Botrimarina hoheduenensis]